MLDKLSIDDISDTLESFPEPVLLIKVEGEVFRLVALNKAAWERFQFRDVALGKSIDESYFSQEIKKRLMRTFSVARTSAKPLVTESSFELPDKTTIWMSNHVYPVLIENAVSHLIVSSVEVTDLVEARNSLKASLSLLASGFVTVCAWCDQVKRGDEWLPADKYYYPMSGSRERLCPACKPD